jgi:hypothetical protein
MCKSINPCQVFPGKASSLSVGRFPTQASPNVTANISQALYNVTWTNTPAYFSASLTMKKKKSFMNVIQGLKSFETTRNISDGHNRLTSLGEGAAGHIRHQPQRLMGLDEKPVTEEERKKGSKQPHILIFDSLRRRKSSKSQHNRVIANLRNYLVSMIKYLFLVIHALAKLVGCCICR